MESALSQPGRLSHGGALPSSIGLREIRDCQYIRTVRKEMALISPLHMERPAHEFSCGESSMLVPGNRMALLVGKVSRPQVSKTARIRVSPPRLIQQMLQPIQHVMGLARRQRVGVDAFEFFFHLAGLCGGSRGAEEVHLLGEADGGGVAGF